MSFLFGGDYDGEGQPILPKQEQKTLSVKEAFYRRCYLNGITDPDTVVRLWAEVVAKREAETKTKGKRKGRR